MSDRQPITTMDELLDANEAAWVPLRRSSKGIPNRI